MGLTECVSYVSTPYSIRQHHVQRKATVQYREQKEKKRNTSSSTHMVTCHIGSSSFLSSFFKEHHRQPSSSLPYNHLIEKSTTDYRIKSSIMHYCKLAYLLLVCASSTTTGFHSPTLVSSTTNTRKISRNKTTSLYNVPPPSIDGDPTVIKNSADRESPPQSFFQLQVNCARAAELAIRDGHRLIEVEVRKYCSKDSVVILPKN